MADRTDQIQRIFHDVLARKPEDRAAYLRSACRDDDELLAEVSLLLDHHRKAAAFLLIDASAPTSTEPRDDGRDESDPLLGGHIGRYHIKRLISSGGMGRIYEAAQESPRRAVAVKVMKPGATSRSALRRFEYEAQILARLRHPNIAQIFEAGTHRNGHGPVPYFAMEYVPNARPITAFAAYRKLGLRERLEMFTQVCDGVHFGHQKGIIHRDLKPDNILVDSSGVPKIIDFGVARATDSDMAVTTIQTSVGQLIGTLQYMSPEQCEADPHDLDTRSDVYALGVVLYELLCGQLPYDVSRAAWHDAPRIIREQPPARPRTVNQSLPSDVETITLKSLEKDRDRRYRSAADLGDDIRHFLHDEPIVARPPSVVYQVRMMARRHRLLFGAAVAILLSVFVALGGAVWGWTTSRRATETVARERDRADAMFREGHKVATVLMDDLNDQIAKLPGALDARTLLVATALEYLQSVAANMGDDPALARDVARGHLKVGRIIWDIRGPNRGRSEEASDLFRRALAGYEALDPRDPETRKGRFGAHLALGDVLKGLDPAESRRHYEDACAMAEGLLQELPADDEAARLAAVSFLEKGDVLKTEGEQLADKGQADLAHAKYEEARALYARSRVIRQSRVERDPSDAQARRELTVLDTHLGYVLKRMGRPADALERYERSLAERALLARESPPQVARARRDLMVAHLLLPDLLVTLGRPDEALDHARAALRLAADLRREDTTDARANLDVARATLVLGQTLHEVGHEEEGRQTLREALEDVRVQEEAFPDDPRIRQLGEEIRDYVLDLDAPRAGE